MIARYPGSKTGSGLIQKIVSLMPEHDRYVEPFVGGGAILESKRPARVTLAGDADRAVILEHRRAKRWDPAGPAPLFVVSDWRQLLGSLDLTMADLVYLDPPYVHSTRSKKRLYKYEMTDADHRDLLYWCRRNASRTRIMISGYRCAVYDIWLAEWTRADFRTMTRGGVRIESVWTSFRPGETFHDKRFLGKDFRDRERIKRKRDRWTSRFLKMAAADRAVIWEALSAASTNVRADDAGDRAAAGLPRA